MKKTIITISVIGILLIIFGLANVIINNNKQEETNSPGSNNETNIDNDSSEEPNVTATPVLDYDTAYSMVVSLYGGEGRTIELEETETHFIIYIKAINGNLFVKSYMDKKTGIISEEGTTITSPPIGETQ